MVSKRLKALFNPEMYHGWGRKKKYFEGWYFKLVNAEKNESFAFIPGIAMDENGNKQAFIQVLDGQNKKAEFIHFDADSFIPSPDKFYLLIENNIFSNEKMNLDLEHIKGEIRFNGKIPWPKKWYSPGIMGPFSFMPMMECYHGIVSMYHDLTGQLTINDQTIDFTGGRGYLEKDWGHSFPSAYVWMQTSHFSEKDISMKLSVAKVPWLGSAFVGFIAGIWLKDRLIRFTTYNFTKLKKCAVDLKFVEVVLINRKYKLEIKAERDSGVELAAPIGGFMDSRITETMTSRIYVKLTDKRSKKVILEDFGDRAGLEIAGNIPEILVDSKT